MPHLTEKVAHLGPEDADTLENMDRLTSNQEQVREGLSKGASGPAVHMKGSQFANGLESTPAGFKRIMDGEHRPFILNPVCNGSKLEEIEREAIALLDFLMAAHTAGDWDPSPVEEKYRLLREAGVRTPGMLRNFRRNFLAMGWLNFPDCPYPKDYYLQWGERAPTAQRIVHRIKGAKKLMAMWCHLRRSMSFRLQELDDPCVGAPMVFKVPDSFLDLVKWFLSSVLRVSVAPPQLRRVTEVQIRMMYNRRQICSEFGNRYGPILEIGGGYGALACEMLRNVSTPTYYLVELPESIPLAYFFLRASFDCPVAVFYGKRIPSSDSARIVLLPPWKLPELKIPLDLVINTMSFQHMDSQNLAFYFGEVERLNAKRMYLVNRNKKEDRTDLPIDDYPIPHSLRLVKDSPWIFGGSAHRERMYQSLETKE